MEKDNIIFFGISNYSNLIGAKILKLWNIQKFDLIIINNIIKTLLFNVQRQEEFFFIDFPIIFLEQVEYNMITFSSFFFNKLNDNSSIYSLFFSFKNKSNQINSRIFNQIKPLLSNFTEKTSNLILNKDNYDFLCNNFILIATEIQNLIFPIINKFEINNFQFPKNFLSSILTSHFQTQMTTIIESSNINLSLELFSFLSKFLLISQKELSSNELSPIPLPGLFLQIVQNQDILPIDYLSKFERPWTWIRLNSFEVYQSPDISIQNQIFLNSFYKNSQKNIKILKSNLIKLIKPSLWSIQFIDKYISSPQYIQNFLCEQKLGNFIRNSMLIIELVSKFIKKNNLLTQDIVENIEKILNLNDKEEIKAIVSLAHFFDQQSYNKMYNDKKIVLLNMMSSI